VRRHHLLNLPLQLRRRVRHARPNRTLTTSASTPPLNAYCGGGDLHSGGYRIFREWLQLPPGELVFEVFQGDESYNREADAIVALKPPLNGR